MIASRGRTPTLLAVTILVGLVASVDGCLSKSEAPPPRYFRPGPVVPAAGQAATPTASEEAAAARPLRLREVTAATHLGERIVWSDPRGEYGFYEGARWTEQPSAYVEAALARVLFEQGRFRRVTGADAPVLDVHVSAFEEVVDAGGRTQGVRVALRLVLATREGQALLERTVVVNRPAASSEDGAAVAQALGEALDEAVRTSAEAIAAAYPPS